MEAALVVLGGGVEGRPIPLPETIFLIGRDRQCHLRPHCERVSKLHCAIAAWAGMVRLRDLRSRNGTFLNGRRILAEVVVGDGDQLRVGTLSFAFRIRNADGSPITRPLSRNDVQWLLDAPPDDAVLSPARQTQVWDEAPEPGEPVVALTRPEASGTKRPSKVVSAGRHLYDYFEQRKHPGSGN